VDPALTYGITAKAYADPEVDGGLDAPPGHQGATPPGLAFSQDLALGLIAAGWEVPFQWVIPSGHGLEIRGGGERFDATLVCVSTEEGSWDLVVEPRRGLLPWRRKSSGPALERLGQAIEEVLRSEPKVRGVEPRVRGAE
jgi:hypothetical protein